MFAILNARYHEQEAYIVAQAGVPGAITIATNMAGRGTDIQLGGNADMRIRQELADIEDRATRDKDPRAAEIRAQVARLKQKALAAGGLYVLGTERHESRRIDNQLRGRSGRQGDPGRSKFFLSLRGRPDAHLRLRRMDGMLQKLGLKEDEAIVHPWINKALEKAQQKVEARNFDIRKNLLKYDDVMNDQRKVIFEQRLELMRDEAVRRDHRRHAPCGDRRPGRQAHPGERLSPSSGTSPASTRRCARCSTSTCRSMDWAKEEGIADEEMQRAHQAPRRRMAWRRKVAKWGPDVMRYVEKSILLQTLDHLWREHLVMLDHLRQVIGLRGYGQRDPLNEYKTEAFELFEAMIAHLREAVTGQLMRVEIVQQPPAETPENLPYMEAQQGRSGDRRGRDSTPAPLAPALVGANGNGGAAQRRAQPEGSDDLGQGRPQRALPVRLRQEVQALPRQERVT